MKSEHEILAEKMLYFCGKLVLGPNSGGMITKLKNNKGIEGAYESLKTASDKDEPREWIGKILSEIAAAVGPKRMFAPEPPRPPRSPEQQAAIDAKIAAFRQEKGIPLEGLPPKSVRARPMREIGKTSMAGLLEDLVARKTRHEGEG